MTSLGTSGVPSPMRETRTRKKEKQFQRIANEVLLCDVGDPKFAALARASGGWSIIKTFNKLLDRPPDYVMKEMGKGEEGVDMSEDDWNELTALVPYITWEWNCHGPMEDKSDPFDYDSLTRERFETFLGRKHSDQKHNHYDPDEAQEPKRTRIGDARKGTRNARKGRRYKKQQQGKKRGSWNSRASGSPSDQGRATTNRTLVPPSPNDLLVPPSPRPESRRMSLRGDLS